MMLLPPGTGYAATFQIDEFATPESHATADGLPSTIAIAPRLRPKLAEAQAAFLDSDFGRAEQLARALSEEVPEMAEVWHLLGLVLANQSRFDESLSALDRSATLYEKNAQPLLVKGDILLHLGRSDEARQAYALAVERDPTDWRAAEALARFLESDGDRKGAMDQYRQAVEHAPRERLLPSLRLAKLLFDDGAIEESILVLSSYVVAAPRDATGVRALGQLLLAAEKPENAAEVLESASAVHAGDLPLGLLTAQALRAAGRYDAAIAKLEALRNAFSDRPQVHVDLAGLLGAIGRYEPAAEAYQTGLDRFPEDRSLLNGLVLAQYRLGRLEEARDSAQRLAGQDGASAGDTFWLGLTEEKLGHTEEALAAYEAALALDRNHWVSANNMASLLLDRDPERAVALAQRATLASKMRPETRNTLGQAFMAAGQSQDALRVFAALVKDAPDNAVFAFRHGQALHDAGDTDAARTELERALSIDPDFDFASEAKALLKID